MTTSARTILDGLWAEKATMTLGSPTPMTITGADGVTPLANADTVLTALTLTLYEQRSRAVINGRSATSIFNVNGGTVTSGGAFTLRLDPADMACVLAGSAEVHVALIEWTWGTPMQGGKHEIIFTVANLEKVT